MRFFLKSILFPRNQDVPSLGNRFVKVCYRFSSASITSDENAVIGKHGENTSSILKVAIIGAPNAGKSTLLNRIVGRSVFAMSRKVHTTRCCARAIMNVDNTQLVFVDTPGVVSTTEGLKHHLERSCLVDSEDAIQEADVVGVLHDVSNKYTKFKLDPKILRLLYLYPDKHTFLILNKIDAMKSRLDLLDCVRILTKHDEKRKTKNCRPSNEKLSEISLQETINEETGWAHFKDVFMVSGLTGDGVGDIQVYLTNLAQPGDWIFPANIVTDQKEIKVIEDTVFSKLLDNLPNVVPYNLRIQLEYFDISEHGSITAVVNIGGKNDKITSYVMGRGGHKIRKIAQQVEQSLKQFYLNDVRVKLVLKKIPELTDAINEDEKDKLLRQS